jgi:flagellar FliJ protein
MAGFQFRLQTLLRLRESARQQRRVELAQACEAEGLLREQLAFLSTEQIETRKRSQIGASPGPVSVDQLIGAHRYASLLLARQRQLEQQRAKVQDEIERRRQALVEADREVRVLEKLRERQREQYQRAEAQREVKALDEVAQRQVRRAGR